VLADRISSLAEAVRARFDALTIEDTIRIVSSFSELDDEEVGDLLIFSLGEGRERYGLYQRQPDGQYVRLSTTGRSYRVGAQTRDEPWWRWWIWW
jgi:hypothetical protein